MSLIIVGCDEEVVGGAVPDSHKARPFICHEAPQRPVQVHADDKYISWNLQGAQSGPRSVIIRIALRRIYLKAAGAIPWKHKGL